MMTLPTSVLFAVGVALCRLCAAEPIPLRSVSFKGPFEVEQRGIHNIHVEYNGDVDGELTIAYGPCDIASSSHAHHIIGRTHIGVHPSAKRHSEWVEQRPTKFVWMTPSDMDPGCLHAYVDGEPLGQSDQLTVKERKLTRRATFADVADPMGPWFDGVAYLEQKQPGEVFVAATKNKTFGILGAGISGLMTSVSSMVTNPSPPNLSNAHDVLVDARLCGYS